jgi:hypothetical protein
MTTDRLPWIKWYSRDALGDPMLRMVGPEARGVWYDMLWVMDKVFPAPHLLKELDAKR